MQFPKHVLMSIVSMNHLFTLICLLLLLLGMVRPLSGQAIPPTHVDNFVGHPRVVVISDIGNEPDDQMSLVRLLLYSNELDIEALIASTSTWQRNALHPETCAALSELTDRCGRAFFSTQPAGLQQRR
jgi:cellulose-binding protein